MDGTFNVVPFNPGGPYDDYATATLSFSVQAGNGGLSYLPTSANASGGGSAKADYANTIRWAGFDSILDAQGQPVSGFSVLSDSGFDYAAVPEPTTAALVMIGMLTLTACRRSDR